MNELNIDLICANSPQAKGRIERANKTLQDRLVKELRLRAISDVVAGQAYLPQFQQDLNRRFARPPRNSFDAHRRMHEYQDLDEIFTLQEQRKVSENLTVNHKRVLQLQRDRIQLLPGAPPRAVLVLQTAGSGITGPATASPTKSALRGRLSRLRGEFSKHA